MGVATIERWPETLRSSVDSISNIREVSVTGEREGGREGRRGEGGRERGREGGGREGGREREGGRDGGREGGGREGEREGGRRRNKVII